AGGEFLAGHADRLRQQMQVSMFGDTSSSECGEGRQSLRAEMARDREVASHLLERCRPAQRLTEIHNLRHQRPHISIARWPVGRVEIVAEAAGNVRWLGGPRR